MNQQQQVRQERQHRATEIIARLKEYAGGDLAQYPVEIAYLYGSVARGQPLPTSDIDIALSLF
jgi:predicted nucleotidyltransferase